MKKIASTCLLFFSLAQSSHAALLGTELSLKIIYQPTSSSTEETIGFLTTAVVDEPKVEFPSVAALDIDGDNFTLVDVSINVGDNYLEIDFDNSSPYSSFSSGYKNGYVFTFDSGIAATITGATIDNNVTTLGLIESDLTFTGNQLYVNVEGLSFNASTFVRINLTVEGGPIIKPQISVNGGFIKLDTTHGSAPDTTDCENVTHDGRMVFDEVNEVLYICSPSGWISK